MRFVCVCIVGFAFWLAGCATPSASRTPEPGIIVIQNATGRDLQSVSLGTVPAKSGATRRIGSIAPVPRNGAPTIVRPSDAPPLPAQCELKWTDAFGKTTALKIDLKDMLKKATGTPTEALVFQIRPDDSVMVFLDR